MIFNDMEYEFLNFPNFADTETRGESLSQEFIVSWETIVPDGVLPHASSDYPAGSQSSPMLFPVSLRSTLSQVNHHLSLKMNVYALVSLVSSSPCPVLGARLHFKNLHLIMSLTFATFQ